MKKITFILLFCIGIFFSSGVHAVNSDLEKIYSNFLTSLEKKYSPEVQQGILVSVRDRVIELLGENLTERRRELLGDLDVLNNEALFELWLDQELSLEAQKQKEASLKSLSTTGKIPYSELIQDFQGIFTQDWKVQKNGDIYYGYNFDTFRYFESDYGVSNRDLAGSDISKDNEITYINEEGRVNFISDYTVYPIAKQSDVFGLPEKQSFLNELREDAQYQSPNISATLSDIRSVAVNLTNGKNKQESIAVIYDWILDNIEYTREIDIIDTQIFSGIETFKTGSGVCTGYTKLMLYMLNYAGIHDVEVIRGHVIDAQDFPTIGHAWIRIGERYYDPTFDDPIGAEATKTVDEYKFYGLPKDIFYANRFEYGELPKSIEEASMDERYAYIFNTLQSLLPKYGEGAKNYLVFKPALFYKKYNIPQGTEITVDYLASKIPTYNVTEGEYSFIENGVTQRITGFQYYPINDENILGILDTIDYDFTDSYFFKWKLPSGETEWRLAYNVKLR